jgi:hypothetical protein
MTTTSITGTAGYQQEFAGFQEEKEIRKSQEISPIFSTL